MIEEESRERDLRVCACACVSMRTHQRNLMVVFLSLELRLHTQDEHLHLRLGFCSSLLLHLVSSSSSCLPSSVAHLHPADQLVLHYAAALQLFRLSPRIDLSPRGQKMEETLPSQRTPLPGQAL